MHRFFTSPAHPAAESIRATLLSTNPTGHAGCCCAIRDMDLRALLPCIAVPTLVIGGDTDVSLPWTGHGEVLASEIRGARAVKIAAAHLSNLERPSTFTNALLEFLLPAPPVDRLEAGFALRRAVLGDAHVDRAVANTTGFTRDFQDLITRYAWGSIWTRPGLDPRTRRLLVLAITAALGRCEEFRLHVRTGLAPELEVADLKELLLQVAIYAGVPAANSAFHIAAGRTARAGMTSLIALSCETIAVHPASLRLWNSRPDRRSKKLSRIPLLPSANWQGYKHVPQMTEVARSGEMFAPELLRRR